VYHGGSFNGNLLGPVAGTIAVSDLTAEEIRRIDSYADAIRSAVEDAARANGVALRTSGVGSAFGLYVLDAPDGAIDHEASALLHLAAVAAALAAARPGRIWHASHLGAAGSLPPCLFCRSDPCTGASHRSAAPDVVVATQAGEVFGALLRGRIGIPQAAQAAQAAISYTHEHLALPRCRDISLVSTTPVDGATVLVRISSPHGLLDVTVKRRRVDAVGLTCRCEPRGTRVISRRCGDYPVESWASDVHASCRDRGDRKCRNERASSARSRCDGGRDRRGGAAPAPANT
jgi:hypothetical protein